MRKLNFVLILVFSFLLFTSLLPDVNEKKEFYQSGELKSRDSMVNDSVSVFTAYYKAGLIYKRGRLLHGRKFGLWKTWLYDLDENGKIKNGAEMTLSAETYVNDILNGPVRITEFEYEHRKPEKDKIVLGQYLNGLKNGEWKTQGIYKDGDSITNLYSNYVFGDLVSKLEWESPRKRWVFYEIRNDDKYGRYTEFWGNGHKRGEGIVETIFLSEGVGVQTRKQEFRTGIWYFWNDSGRLIQQDIYGYLPHEAGKQSDVYRIEYSQGRHKSGEGWVHIKSDHKEGLWLFWNDSGRLLKSEFYYGYAKLLPHQYKDTTLKFIEENGQLIRYTHYKDGKKEGKEVIIKQKLAITLNYQANRREGKVSINTLDSNTILIGKCHIDENTGIFTRYKKGVKQETQEAEFEYSKGRLKEYRYFGPDGLMKELHY